MPFALLNLRRLATPTAVAALLPLAAALATLLPANAAQAQTAIEADLARRLDLLAAEVQRLQAQLREVQQQQAAPPAAAVVAVPGAAAAPASSGAPRQ